MISDKVQIWTRWGELIFESSDLDYGWDGTFKGKKCPFGVYTYKIKYKGYGIKFIDEGITRIGSLTLIR